MKFKPTFAKVAAALAVLGLVSCTQQSDNQSSKTPAKAAVAIPADKNIIKLTVLETTDLHGYYTAYDYYKESEVKAFGLTRTATLIREQRAKAKNSVLVDNGDLIQGNLIADWALHDNFRSFQIHPAYLAFQNLNYDVSNLGNHEFNFGLPYLQKVVDTAVDIAKIPVINANVYHPDGKTNYYTPYIIKPTQLVDEKGQTHTVKIGYIGFTPPQIMQWDADKLTGKVTVKPIVQSAQEFIPKMKAEGAEVIIAVPHSGIGIRAPSTSLFANQVINLTKVPGIDAVMFGHSHGVFPGPEYAGVGGADVSRGTINGVPSVMPGRWGSHLGVANLVLEQQADGTWKANAAYATTEALPVYDFKTDTVLAQEDLVLKTLYKNTHESTRKFANRPLGKVDQPMYGYLALTQDDNAVKFVNQAQLAELQAWVNSSEGVKYADYKLLSAAAPFKYGERHNDPTNFTHVDGEQLVSRNIADIYFYPNTFAVLEISGKDVRNWLECSAGVFNQIFSNTSQQQELLNYQSFKTYNFDVIYGVQYSIDVTKPARYTSSCRPTGSRSNRIVDLTYQGQPIKDSDKFLLATNNYRANSTMFPGAGTQNIVHSTLDTMQEVIARYIRKHQEKNQTIKLDTTTNWYIRPIADAQNLNVYLFSAPSEFAVNYALNHSVYPLIKEGLDYAGFQLYKVDLSQYNPEKRIVKTQLKVPSKAVK